MKAHVFNHSELMVIK